MGRPSFREQLIDSGVLTVHRRGFATVGVRELTAAAGVAQGSFTNHFASKEALGAAVVERYAEQMGELLDQTLGDQTLRPLARLRAFFQAIIERLAESEWRYGCLAGNMALEAAEHSTLIREQVAVYLHGVEAAFAEVLREAQQAGELKPRMNTRETAAILHEAWQGAMLRMKVERTSAPLQRFMRRTLPVLLDLPSNKTLKSPKKSALPRRIAKDKR